MTSSSPCFETWWWNLHPAATWDLEVIIVKHVTSYKWLTSEWDWQLQTNCQRADWPHDAGYSESHDYTPPKTWEGRSHWWGKKTRIIKNHYQSISYNRLLTQVSLLNDSVSVRRTVVVCVKTPVNEAMFRARLITAAQRHDKGDLCNQHKSGRLLNGSREHTSSSQHMTWMYKNKTKHFPMLNKGEA